MTTARDIIEAAHRKIGVLGRGQTLTADQAEDALDMLNAMLSSWSVEGGLVYAETAESFPLTSSASYTIGSGGDFNTSLPTEIVAGFVRIGSEDYNLEMIDRRQYAEITQKDLSSYVPDQLYYDYNYPLGTIRLFPVPTTGTLHLYTNKVLDSFASLDAVVNLPAGYERALIFNLAVEISPDFEIEASPSVQKIAHTSKENVLIANTRNENNQANLDGALFGNQGNIYSGWYV